MKVAKTLTIDFSEIKDACDRFSLPLDEPWFEFSNEVIWMNWVYSADEIREIFHRRLIDCVDVYLEDDWHALEDLKEDCSWINEEGFTRIRYIVEAV